MDNDDYVGVFIFVIFFFLIVFGIVLLLWYYYRNPIIDPYNYKKLYGVEIKSTSSLITITVPSQPEDTILVANTSKDGCVIPIKESTDSNTKTTNASTTGPTIITLIPIGSNTVNYVTVAAYNDINIISLDTQKVWIPGSNPVPTSSGFTIANVDSNKFIIGNPLSTQVYLSNNSILDISCVGPQGSINPSSSSNSSFYNPSLYNNSSSYNQSPLNNLASVSLFNTSNVQKQFYNSDKNCTNKSQTVDMIGNIPIRSLNNKSNTTNTINNGMYNGINNGINNGMNNGINNGINNGMNNAINNVMNNGNGVNACYTKNLNGAVWSYLPSGSSGGNLCIQGFQSCPGNIVVGNQSGQFVNQCLSISSDNLVMGPKSNATSWTYSNNKWCDSNTETKCLIYDGTNLTVGTPTNTDRWINYPV